MASIARSALTAPLAICCLLLVLLLIASTIILALIPVYITTKDVDLDTSNQQETLSAGYASDSVGSRSDTLTDTSSLSTQLVNSAGVSSSNLGLNSGSFLSSTAASRKRRQTINSDGTVTCEKSTGLTGDIFQASYIITYPITCSTKSSRSQYKKNLINSLRKNYQVFTVTMNFTLAGSKTVRLVFCGIFSESSTGCTTETKKYAYLLDIYSKLYQFDPTNLTVTSVGTINCSTSQIYSIALQRNGILWAAYSDKSLYRYNIRSGQCFLTNFQGNQTSFFPFTITFLKSSTGTSETLYASKQVLTNASLATIDTNSYTLSTVGTYNNLSTYADIAGLNDGRLYGVFDASPYTIAQINSTNAQIIAQYPLNRSSGIADYNYGFTAYNTKFYFFVGNGTSGNFSDLLTFDLSTNTTTYQKTFPQIIISATSSSCLGTS